MVLNPTHPDTLRMNSKKIGFDIASLVGKDSMEESRMRREMALLAPHFDSHKFDVRYRPYARNTARSRHSEADLQNDGQKKHRYSPKHHSDTEAEHEHVAKVQEGGFRIKSEASPNLPTSRYPVASMENEHRLKFLHNTNVANSRSQPVASPRQFSPISPTRHMGASYVEEKAQVRSASSEYPSAISASSPNQDRLSLSAPTMYPGAHNGLKPALGFPYQLTPYNNDPATAAIIDRIFLQAAAAASGMRQPGSTPVMPASIPTTCVPALPPMPVAARHPFIPTPTSPWLMKQTPIHPLQYTDALLRSRFELMMANPFQRKPKRIRTAFTPGQLLQLEHEFDKNHYVVGTERKQLARSLKLSETQVKVWFQNRRTKYKREKIDDKSSSGERSQSPEEIEEPDEIDLNEEDEAQIDKEEAEYERMRQQQHMNKSKIEEMASNHAMYIKPERIDE